MKHDTTRPEVRGVLPPHTHSWTSSAPAPHRSAAPADEAPALPVETTAGEARADRVAAFLEIAVLALIVAASLAAMWSAVHPHR